MGFFWALLSVGLVSAAQLLLRSAMVALPPLTDIVAFLQHLLHFPARDFRPVFRPAGLPAVDGLLVLCPPCLPLSKAYALLSLSYILVWAAAIWLPGWHEPFYWQSLLGVAIIVAGVLTIFWPGETPLAGEPAFGTARAEQDRQLAASDGGFHPDFTDAG
ncbi:4-amino-4-deoxy-L-arabinose-phospho-UDP flippase subunit F [Klebsiella pneumoniae]|uniref:4-amino-4-deoxy-L-arabinose-phospho-UDP flippase subunit F n=1 Tax=Klebsiella pneumoniae TaxID=573 RepID=A0A377ZYX3_KLEPN|nr:4-amino-4-deoxy-L-arabinose-phospho-UDP flippase subunit F [Klebsiella pneumoniae]